MSSIIILIILVLIADPTASTQFIFNSESFHYELDINDKTHPNFVASPNYECVKTTFYDSVAEIQNILKQPSCSPSVISHTDANTKKNKISSGSLLSIYRAGSGSIWIFNTAAKNFTPIYHEGDPGSGIGGFDLKSKNDEAFAFDYDHSGVTNHICIYRPGSGALWILKHEDGDFTPVYHESDPGSGIGGFDLKSPDDRAFAFDYDHSGKLDHIVFYRPGTGVIWILKNHEGVFSPVFQEGNPGRGIGGYDLKFPADRAFAFDYDHSGKMDHIVLYRPGTGTIWILKNENGVFTPVFYERRGIAGFDLTSPDYDNGFAFDYDHSGKRDHLVFYRKHHGIIMIFKNNNGIFTQVYPNDGKTANGIGGYDVRGNDVIFAYDYKNNGLMDHLVLYRIASRRLWIVKNENGTFYPVYSEDSPKIFGVYDMTSANDKVFALGVF